MAFHLYSSNQLEALAREFGEKIYSQSSGNLLVPEEIIVPTGGMASFLQQHLSQQHGIAGNIKFLYPQEGVYRILAALLEPEQLNLFNHDRKYFSVEKMSWEIHRLMRRIAPDFPELAQYAPANQSESIADTNCHQLSMRLAKLFDRAFIHRPQIIEELQKGKLSRHWQGVLCQKLCAGGHHTPDWYFRQALQAQELAPNAKLPHRISAFGISVMPKLFLQMLNKAGEFTEVHFFYLTPCREFWGDLRSRSERRKDEQKYGEVLPGSCDNPLLSELGVQGREFQDILTEVCDLSGNETELFVEYPENDASILEKMQSDIFNLTDRKPVKAENDRSIVIANCHTPRREVEILHDMILDAISRDKLQSRDIIIMAPDINIYAPIIKMVFSSGPLGDQYSFNDRSIASTSQVARLLKQLPELALCRGESAVLMDIISSAPIRDNWQISNYDLPKLENLIRKAAIVWGENEEEHAINCGNPYLAYSWEDGLNRCLIGYALGDCDNPDLDAAPVAIHDSEAVLLGKVITIVQELFKIRGELNESHTLSEWKDLLLKIIDTLCGDAPNFRDEAKLIKKEIQKKQQAAGNNSFQVDFGSISEEWLSHFTLPVENRLFLRGKITCCSMIPMRSIPAGFIAILGLENGKFPRYDNDYSFSFMRQRLPGEPSRQLEDNYLFLETILSARKKLLLTYCGQAPDGDKDKPPSAALALVIDYLDKTFGIKPVNHYLHNFDWHYFAGTSPDYFSYSADNCKAADTFARQISLHTIVDLPAGQGVLPQTITVDELFKILQHPCREFLIRNAGLSRYQNENLAIFNDREPERLPYKVEFESLFKYPDIKQLPSGEELFRQRLLPPGEAGSYILDQLQEKCLNMPEEFSAKFRRLQDTVIDININGYRICGILPVTDNGEFLYIAPNADKPPFKAHIYLTMKLNQLLTGCNLGTDTIPATHCYCGKSQKVHSLPEISRAEAEAQLSDIISLAEKGFAKPLILFPETCALLAQTKSYEKCYHTGLERFENGNKFAPAECEDPFIKILFGESDFDELYDAIMENTIELYHPEWSNHCQ